MITSNLVSLADFESVNMFSSQLQVEGKGKKWRCIVASRCHVLLHGTDISLSAPFMPAFEGFQPDNGLLTNAGTTCAFNSRSVCPLEGSTYSEEKLIIKE